VSAVEEARRFNEQLERTIAAGPRIERLPPEVTRAGRRAGRSIFGRTVFLDQARTIAVPGRAGEIPLRLLLPDRPEGVYLHVHGGGWVLDAADLQDEWLWRIATEAGVAVASVEYRLAPEHPDPSGLEDVEDALAWLAGGGGAELAAGPLALGGESAGANLAVLALLRLRDRHGIPPRRFAAANLVFGPYDLSGTPSRRRWTRRLVLDTPMMDWFERCYLGDREPEARRDPEISPLYADLSGLPPALFTVGTEDPLLDDSLFMHARWAAAGNASTLSVHEGGAHAFTAFDLEIARRANDEQIAFLRTAVRDARRRAPAPPAGSRAAPAGIPSARRTSTTGCTRS
jgi:acetyl esterase/lipase